jgi:hypothetical protein
MNRPLWALAGIALLGSAGGISLLTGGVDAQQGQLGVTPDSGPVGTTVVLEGSGCNNPGQPAYLVFQNGLADSATVGAETVSGNIPVNSEGRFRMTYAIPFEFAPGSLQGTGGGPLAPGVYFFVSRPVICQAKFVVTPHVLPESGGEPGGPEGIPLLRVALVIAGSMVLLVGLAIATTRQVDRGARRTAKR